MRVIVYGAGAIGGAIAAALCFHGHKVVAIARGAQLDVMRNQGLTVRHPGGEITARPPVVADPAEIDLRPDDAIILAMKSQDTAPALARLKAAGARRQPIFCFQNAIANEPTAARFFRNVHGVTVMMPATFLRPGYIDAFGTPCLGMFDMGRFPAGHDAADIALGDLLDACGFKAFVRDDVMACKRGKLVMNLGNIVEAALGHGAERGDFPGLARAEAEEVFAAARLAWQDVGQSDPRRDAYMRMGVVPGADRAGSSTSQSLLRGTGSLETEYLNGEIRLLGRVHGVATPVNDFLTDLAADLLAAKAGPGAMTLADLEAAYAVWKA